MSIDIAREHLRQWGKDDRILEFPTSSATVEMAATAVGTMPARICKTLAFRSEGGCVLVQTAGDAMIDNGKFKSVFGMKARMLSPDETLCHTGHRVGGVCAFGISRDDVRVFADVSLKRFTTVFPACGSDNSAVELSPMELFEISGALRWIDVCRDWDESLCV
ncbi:MAG: YbaK/EbsC family protein [Clostridiales Family XIII bacterium]|jgi:prolyl-tRNA editing enzyme YbaK/EbsC (Cys-tRNA(Pro) deacylase)|nr:YbaK/EbsC family protein [Clostridiales Family XIII bacterium]